MKNRLANGPDEGTKNTKTIGKDKECRGASVEKTAPAGNASLYKDSSIKPDQQEQATRSQTVAAKRQAIKAKEQAVTKEKAIKITLLFLQAVNWATPHLREVIGVCMLVAGYFLLTILCFEGDGVEGLVGGIARCWKERGTSCLELKDIFFRPCASSKSYQVAFKLSDPIITAPVPILLDVKFPLLLRHPITLLLVLFFLFVSHRLLSCLEESLPTSIDAIEVSLFH